MVKLISISVDERTLEAVNEMREVLKSQEGTDPGTSRIFRIAALERYKRMTNEGLIKAAK